jgi:shikimate kinase
VLLVGFMGSGKTCVGRSLALRLGWTFHDFDTEICGRVGLSISEIFRQHGEGFFRDMEERVGEELLQERDVVLASGGGWPARPGRMEGVPPGTFSVWLEVPPRVAVERALKEGPTRPLLTGSDPFSQAKALLEEREPFYRKAAFTLDSCRSSPEELAEGIQRVLNEKRFG